ncbi:hypothetical protein GDO81_023057, partial [Engystomops pustulosus]
FSSDLRVNICLFIIFLAIYVATIIGNGLIILVTLINPRLHIPMYFFLCILSFLDLCTSTAVVPKLLADFFSAQKSISLGACALQLYTVLLVSGTESLLLALMAYDRYVAICRPLHYPVLMSWRTCHCLTALVWIVNFVIIIIPSVFMSLELCYPNHINHFMCESLAVMQLACDDIFGNTVLMLLTCFIAILLPFWFVIASYGCIISSILKIPSKSRLKAFSTCTSHITVVVLAYGSALLLYFGPSSQYSTKHGKYFSVFSFVICPSLNPLIYTLNNKDVKSTMRRPKKN